MTEYVNVKGPFSIDISVAHSEENVAAAGLELPQAAYDKLSAVSHSPASLRG
jgi:hypothetical protein